MARGGKQPGAGRPKGTKTRPQLRDFFTDEELLEFIKDLKETAKTDPGLKKFVAEQIFGKAVQAVEVGGVGGKDLFSDGETREKSKKATEALLKGGSD